MARRGWSRGRLRSVAGVLVLAAAGALLVGWGHSARPAVPKTSTPHRGGTLTVLETSAFAGAWPVGLDPATNTSDAADIPYMNAIYGTLFQAAKHGRVTPSLATGYKFSSDFKTLTISLRHGVTFSDGTPFNAQAVAFNITRDLTPKYANIADAFFPVASITTPDTYTVVLHLKRPFSPIISAFIGEAPNWIASPTSLRKMGTKRFALYPVGAGPFTVAKDNINAELIVKKNPTYWEKGKPYLNEIDFKSVGNDNSALDAMITGQGDVEQFFASPQLLAKAKRHVRVISVPSTLVLNIQLNTSIPPFNNILAREAVYYATDQGAINKALSYGTGTVTQSPSGPGSMVYMRKVKGYRSFDLAKAKALVKQLGGLSFTYDGGTLGSGSLLSAALVADFKRAGMHVKLNTLHTLQATLEAFSSNKWQAIGQGVGGVNPFVGAGGFGWRFLSSGPFTGVHDPTLDAMIDQGASVANGSKAQKDIIRKIFSYISQKAYSPMIYATPGFDLAAHSVHGPGLSNNDPIHWQDAWMRK